MTARKDLETRITRALHADDDLGYDPVAEAEVNWAEAQRELSTYVVDLDSGEILEGDPA